MAARILEAYHKFNLSITVRKWVTVSTCQVGILPEIEFHSALLLFHCILKCKWLMFSQSCCKIESFLWRVRVRAAEVADRHRNSIQLRWGHFRDGGVFSPLYCTESFWAVQTDADASVFLFAWWRWAYVLTVPLVFEAVMVWMWTSSHILTYLNTWFLVRSAVWEGYGYSWRGSLPVGSMGLGQLWRFIT